MKQRHLSREEVRRVDAAAIDRYGMSGGVLMENAGRGAAEIIARVAPPASIVVLCGRGNNAGDGYVLARHLELLGRSVRVLSLVDFDTLEGDALANYRIASHADIECRRVSSGAELTAALDDSGTIVECLLGTGASGAPRDFFGEAVVICNDCQCMRIAIDVPAGVDCDTGEAHEPAFRAHHTITFVATKPGFSRRPAESLVGEVHVAAIGVPKKLLAEFGL